MKVYKLYTELLDYEPLIWRRLLVTDAMKMSNFAYALMYLYEMEGEHLFNFYFPEKDMYYGIPDESDDEIGYETVDARRKSLRDVINVVGQDIIFNYDFGDNWEVAVRLEDITDPEFSHLKYPIVLEGEGYGIIEDCGGVSGLEDMAEAFREKKGPNYEEYREWLGKDDIDLKTFSADHKDLRNLRAGMSFFRSIYERSQLLFV